MLGFKFGKIEKKAFVFALVIALCTASYTMIDGLGARGTHNPLIFVAWLYIIDAIPFTVVTVFIKKDKVIPFVRHNWKGATVGGLLTIISYGLVIYVMTLINISVVAALR